VSGLAAGADSIWAIAGFDLVRVDAATGRVTARTRLGPAYPVAVAFGEGAVWVLGLRDDGRRRVAALWRIDPATGRRQGPAIGMRVGPVGLAAGAGAVWVLDRDRGRLLGFSPRTRRLVHEVAVGRAPRALAVSRRAVWVTRAGLRARPVRPGSVPCTLVRVDPVTGATSETTVPRGCRRDGLVASPPAAWVSAQRRLVTRVGPSDAGRVTRRVGAEIAAMAVSGARLWLLGTDGSLSTLTGRRLRRLPGQLRFAAPLPPASRFAAQAFLVELGGSLWSAARVEGALARIDATSGRLIGRVAVGLPPGGPAGAHGLQLTLPRGWAAGPAVEPPQITDPRTRLIVSSHPMRTRTSPCQLGVVRVPPAAAVVVVLEWRERSAARARRCRRGCARRTSGSEPVRSSASRLRFAERPHRSLPAAGLSACMCWSAGVPARSRRAEPWAWRRR
jgi:hypothetical protein